MPPDLLEVLEAGEGQVIIASSKANEKSYCNLNDSYSVFTICLLEALQGKATAKSDSYVRIFQVLDYLFAQVPKRAAPNSQHPAIERASNLDGDLAICYKKGRKYATNGTHEIEVFISYAVEDEALLDRLEVSLEPVCADGIRLWDQGQVKAGGDRNQQINQHLNSAQIILLLVSPDFLYSQDCNRKMHQVIQRYDAKEVYLIPIVLRPVGWEKPAFNQLQPLPKRGKPITSWENQDDAFLDVTNGIVEVITSLCSNPSDQSDSTDVAPDAKVSSDTNSSTDFNPPSPPKRLPRPSRPLRLDSAAYLEHPQEQDCYEEIIEPGALIRIKGTRQVGKTSLMMRVLHYAKQLGYRCGSVDLRALKSDSFTEPEEFWHQFCLLVNQELNLTKQQETQWHSYNQNLSSRAKYATYFEDNILFVSKTPIVLGLDGADIIFKDSDIGTSFLPLIRSWYQQA
jgi:hypothetical protein